MEIDQLSRDLNRAFVRLRLAKIDLDARIDRLIADVRKLQKRARHGAAIGG